MPALADIGREEINLEAGEESRTWQRDRVATRHLNR